MQSLFWLTWNKLPNINAFQIAFPNDKLKQSTIWLKVATSINNTAESLPIMNDFETFFIQNYPLKSSNKEIFFQNYTIIQWDFCWERGKRIEQTGEVEIELDPHFYTSKYYLGLHLLVLKITLQT